MFNNPAPISSSWEEGSVTEVDVNRKVCKVKTLSGQNLTGVRWLQTSGGSTRHGDRMTPTMGDQVVFHSCLGYPLIVGFLPKLQNNENIFSLDIDSGEELIDTGNFSDAGGDVRGDQNSPKDTVVGDRVFASTGGGILALLRGGSLLLRSSRLAEIFISKWDDCVRIVSRNWEHYTDVSSDIVKNLTGRIYRYTGYAKDFKDAKTEDYVYHEFVGDVALAEAIKTNYQDAGTLPAASDVIFKEQVTPGGGSSSELYKRELHLDGTQDIVVKNGSTFTRIKSTNGEIVITHNDTNVIKVNANEISAKRGGDQHLTIMDASGTKVIYNGAEVKLDSAGITSTFEGGVHKIDSSGVKSTKGGHFINVSSSGIQFG